MEKLYGKDRKTILREFQTTEKGLSDNEVRNRKDIFGDNALKEKAHFRTLSIQNSLMCVSRRLCRDLTKSQKTILQS